MMRKDIKIRISCDMRGKITTGMKSEKGFPMSLDYFDISEFPELRAAYGEKPSKLVLIFPSNNIEDFVFTEYSQWGGKGKAAVKKRYCDGESCTFNAAGKVNGKTIEPGTSCPCVCKQFNLTGEDACKCYTSLKAFVVNPNTGKIENHIPYKFESHSVNSSDNVLTEVIKISQMTGGRLMGVPFLMSVTMKETLKAGEKRKFPIWSIQAVGKIDNVLAFAEKGFLPVHASNALAISAGDLETPKALASGSANKVSNVSASVAPQDAELSLDLQAMSPQREKLLSAFVDHQSNFTDGAPKFKNIITATIKRNWSGNAADLSDDELRACINKVKS